MFGSIRVCVPVNIFFVFSSAYIISLNTSIFTFYMFVCLHVCACSYATCVWPEFYMQ